METKITGKALVLGKNIDTDQIYPGRFIEIVDPKEIGKRCLYGVDPDLAGSFPRGGIVIAGSNFGCGSSREHAALVPLYLGIKAVVAKSFARIHAANLVNAGILPFTFADAADYEKIETGDVLALANIRQAIAEGSEVALKNTTKNECYALHYDLSERQRDILVAGGLLEYTKQGA
jgi:aconitate hydratase